MELREYLRGLRRHWLAICLMTLVGLAAAFGWYLLQTPVYQATAIGLVQTREVAQEQEQNENLVLLPQFDGFARSKIPTYMEMATWRVVAEGAIADLGLDGEPERGRLTHHCREPGRHQHDSHHRHRADSGGCRRAR